MGKWVTKCPVNILAHEPLECQENKTLQPKGMYTMDEEKGVGLLSGPLSAFLSRGEGVEPPI